jgi:hypothetical protein
VRCRRRGKATIEFLDTVTGHRYKYDVTLLSEKCR